MIGVGILAVALGCFLPRAGADLGETSASAGVSGAEMSAGVTDQSREIEGAGADHFKRQAAGEIGTAAPYPAAAAARHRVLILSTAIHTDIALPAEPAVRARFGFLAAAGLPVEREDVGAIIVGWGGRDFYLNTPTWADLKPASVLRAFTGDASVLHVGLSGRIDAPADGAPAEGVRAIDLDDDQFAALLGFILASLSRDAAGRPVAVDAPGYGAFDRFFEAEGHFTALAGCNAWTAAALRAAGITTGLWTPLPKTLLWSLDLHGL